MTNEAHEKEYDYDSSDHKYNYNLKDTSDRGSFIEQKLGFIWDIDKYKLMGYSDKGMSKRGKFNNIPRLIDGYTGYFLESKDVDSSRKTEYSYFARERDMKRLKSNTVLFTQSIPFESGYTDHAMNYDYEDSVLSPMETYVSDGSNIDGLHRPADEFETIYSRELKNVLSINSLDKSGYKRVLAYSVDILYHSRDEELKQMVEQIIFNCRMHAQDEDDLEILKSYISGKTMEEISDKLGTNRSTISRRLDRMLEWVGM